MPLSDVTLIINVLVSDVIQASGFLINWYWLRKDVIGLHREVCDLQGFLLQLGNSATAFFVILIALHTLKLFITPSSPKINDKVFKSAILFTWSCCLLMAFIPQFFAYKFFSNVGVWCWISSDQAWARLYLHYAYLFLAELTSICVYGGLGTYLWIHRKQFKNTELTRVAKCMFMYPIAYTLGTLPLALTRSEAMAGRHITARHLIVVCCIFSVQGSMNCAVYVLTRHSILRREREARRSTITEFRRPTLSRPGSDAQSADSCQKDVVTHEQRACNGYDLDIDV